MFDRCGPEYCIKKITDYIDQNAPIDLITVQETDHGGKNFGQFLNNTYQVSDKIGDATVFYNQNQWQLKDYRDVPVSPDKKHDGGRGGRNLRLSYLENQAGQGVVVASTHLCVNWSQSFGCVFENRNNIQNTQWAKMIQGSGNDYQSALAHIDDAFTIIRALRDFHPDAPQILTGDFNTQFLGDNKVLPKIFTQETLGGSQPLFASDYFYEGIWDFIYHTPNLSVIDQKKPGHLNSDHPALDITFKIGDGPTPPIEKCQAPIIKAADKHFDRNSGVQFKWDHLDGAQYRVAGYFNDNMAGVKGDQFSDVSAKSDYSTKAFSYTVHRTCANGLNNKTDVTVSVQDESKPDDGGSVPTSGAYAFKYHLNGPYSLVHANGLETPLENTGGLTVSMQADDKLLNQASGRKYSVTELLQKLAASHDSGLYLPNGLFIMAIDKKT